MAPLLFLCLLLVLPAGMAQAQKAKAKSRKKPARIEMNFRNVDLVNFLSIMSTALGVAFEETGIIVPQFDGGEIRPVGKRKLAVIAGLP